MDNKNIFGRIVLFSNLFHMTDKNQPPKPESWITSDNFLKRCFGIWGHFMVAHLMISFGVFIVVFLFAMLLVAIIGSTMDFDPEMIDIMVE